jgi:hypothetical protein
LTGLAEQMPETTRLTQSGSAATRHSITSSARDRNDSKIVRLTRLIVWLPEFTNKPHLFSPVPRNNQHRSI